MGRLTIFKRYALLGEPHGYDESGTRLNRNRKIFFFETGIGSDRGSGISNSERDPGKGREGNQGGESGYAMKSEK
jgi:hypothetical protein